MQNPWSFHPIGLVAWRIGLLRMQAVSPRFRRAAGVGLRLTESSLLTLHAPLSCLHFLFVVRRQY